MMSLLDKTNSAYIDNVVHEALRCGKLEQLLKDGLSPDFIFTSTDFGATSTGKTLLQIAIIDGNLDLISLLIKYNCDVNSGVKKFTAPNGEEFYRIDRNLDDLTGACLFYAICGKNVAAVKLLIDAGADVSIKCSDMTSALTHAIDSECMDIVQIISRAKNCDLNAQDIYGLSPLHVAVINGRADIVALLLKKRAIVNIEQCQGGTPLFMISDYVTLKVLLEYGADPNHNTKEDANCGKMSALSSVLRRCRDIKVIESLVYAGAQVTADAIKDFEDLPWILRMYPELHAWLKQQYSTPRTLKVQCALCIRKSLIIASDGVGLGVNKRVYLLPIPNLIKSYILMKFV